MDTFTWIPIKYYPNYEVSTSGQIRNSKTSRVLKPCVRNGYWSVTLCKNNKKKTINIHVMVAEAYLEKPGTERRYVVNHINEDKQDNRLCNLEYVTYAQNTQYSATSIRTKNTKEYDLFDFIDIPNYTMYMISHMGDIYSKNRKRLISTITIPSGYKKIKLKSDDGIFKDIYVHVLIAMTYLNYTPTNRYIVINHKDGIKTNNHITNLEIISQRENMVHSVKLNHNNIFRKGVYYMKEGELVEFASAKEASLATKIDHSSIIKSCKNHKMLAGNIKWFYKK